MKIYFATSNEGKFREAMKVAEKFGIELERADIDVAEPQAEIKEIALEKVKQAFEILKNREAFFKCAAAYFDGERKLVVVESVKGRISESVKGEHGFGFDPIFIPEGYEKTFAEIPEVKIKLSHRTRALEKLFNLLQSPQDILQ